MHEDTSQSLAPKERYALTTEIVNISLKVLTDAAKSHPNTDKATSNSVSNTPQRSSRSPCTADRALQVRAGNATPVKIANLKSKDDLRSPAKPTEHGLSQNATDWTAIAECSRLAFSHLRSVNPDKLGVKGLPKLQLEKGMVALAGKLSLLHLDNLAAKELHAAKKRFLALQSADQRKAAASSKTGDKDSLASSTNTQSCFAFC